MGHMPLGVARQAQSVYVTHPPPALICSLTHSAFVATSPPNRRAALFERSRPIVLLLMPIILPPSLMRIVILSYTHICSSFTFSGAFLSPSHLLLFTVVSVYPILVSFYCNPPPPPTHTIGMCPCWGSDPASEHPAAQKPPLGRGPPLVWGVHLDAPGQQRE